MPPRSLARNGPLRGGYPVKLRPRQKPETSRSTRRTSDAAPPGRPSSERSWMPGAARRAGAVPQGTAPRRRVDPGAARSANNNAPGRIRTCDLRIRSPLLYPAELRGRARQDGGRPGGQPRASSALASPLSAPLSTLLRTFSSTGPRRSSPSFMPGSTSSLWVTTVSLSFDVDDEPPVEVLHVAGVAPRADLGARLVGERDLGGERRDGRRVRAARARRRGPRGRGPRRRRVAKNGCQSG